MPRMPPITPWRGQCSIRSAACSSRAPDNRSTARRSCCSTATARRRTYPATTVRPRIRRRLRPEPTSSTPAAHITRMRTANTASRGSRPAPTSCGSRRRIGSRFRRRHRMRRYSRWPARRMHCRMRRAAPRSRSRSARRRASICRSTCCRSRRLARRSARLRLPPANRAPSANRSRPHSARTARRSLRRLRR